METIRAAESAKGLILCVEDEPDLRADILEELRSSGHEAVGAADGRQALEILQDVRPDLILCDISMPKMGGYELLEALRSRRADLDDVPFVFLTALNERDDVISGTRAGADDYLVKPIDFDLMLASVEARIARSRRIRANLSSASGQEPADALGNGMTSEILDILNFGVVLVGGRGEVVFANRFARTLADNTYALSLSGRLRAGTGDLTRILHARIGEVASAAVEGGDAVQGMVVTGPDGESELMLVICALPGHKTPCDTGAPAAAIFVSDPSHRPEPPGHLLASLFGLTPAEAQVAHGLVRGQRSAEIARDLAISQTTVAFHLRNLFEKTGTNRQADLIALVMRTLSVVK